MGYSGTSRWSGVAPVAGRYSFLTWEEYVQQRWDMDDRRANQIMEVAVAAEQMGKIFPVLPSKESHVRELLKLESDDHRAELLKDSRQYIEERLKREYRVQTTHVCDQCSRPKYYRPQSVMVEAHRGCD